jgi:hypothetical protein
VTEVFDAKAQNVDRGPSKQFLETIRCGLRLETAHRPEVKIPSPSVKREQCVMRSDSLFNEEGAKDG